MGKIPPISSFVPVPVITSLAYTTLAWKKLQGNSTLDFGFPTENHAYLKQKP